MCKSFRNFILDILFLKFCPICDDCQSILEPFGNHQKYSTPNLKGLYFAVGYQNPLIQKLIQKFKYEPFIKELLNPYLL